MDPITQLKQNTKRTIEALKEELKSIRTGRANPSLVENIIVETYGGTTKLRLMETATIATVGPQALSLVPFDPSIISDLERAILKSPLGLSPTLQGNRLLIKIPPLTSEQRDKFVKLAGVAVEERKNIIRNLRDGARKTIKTASEKKEISEDEKYRLEKEIDELTQKLMEEIQRIKETKEREILEI